MPYWVLGGQPDLAVASTKEVEQQTAVRSSKAPSMIVPNLVQAIVPC